VVGFGAAQSGAPPIPPLPRPMPQASNEGLELAIAAAMKDAGIGPSDIDAIVPQACGIPALDQPEAQALRHVFGERLSELPLVTVAPFIGDCAAGNGGILAAVAAMCLREQRLPARLHAVIPPADLRAGPSLATAARLRSILVCSSSYGGQNAALILSAAA
jgi:3-oxoacyl-(acyl-carrier-protein) synthase